MPAKLGAGRSLLLTANPRLRNVLDAVRRLNINFSNLCLFVDQQERLSVTIHDIRAFYSASFFSIVSGTTTSYHRARIIRADLPTTGIELNRSVQVDDGCNFVSNYRERQMMILFTERCDDARVSHGKFRGWSSLRLRWQTQVQLSAAARDRRCRGRAD